MSKVKRRGCHRLGADERISRVETETGGCCRQETTSVNMQVVVAGAIVFCVVPVVHHEATDGGPMRVT